MSNKNRGFVRQITMKEMHARFYREMCQEWAKRHRQTTPNPDIRNERSEATSDPHPPTASANEDVSPGDPSERYRMAKTHTSSQNLGEWLHQNREDYALCVSPGFAEHAWTLTYVVDTITGLPTPPT